MPKQNISAQRKASSLVRRAWLEKEQKWVFSIVDVVGIRTDSIRPRKYWSDLKVRVKDDRKELFLKIGQLKMKALDGKLYNTDVADFETICKLMQIVSCPEAKHFNSPYLKTMFKLRSESKSPLAQINI